MTGRQVRPTLLRLGLGEFYHVLHEQHAIFSIISTQGLKCHTTVTVTRQDTAVDTISIRYNARITECI